MWLGGSVKQIRLNRQTQCLAVFHYLRLIETISDANPTRTNEYVNRLLTVMYVIGATSFQEVTEPPCDNPRSYIIIHYNNCQRKFCESCLKDLVRHSVRRGLFVWIFHKLCHAGRWAILRPFQLASANRKPLIFNVFSSFFFKNIRQNY